MGVPMPSRFEKFISKAFVGNPLNVRPNKGPLHFAFSEAIFFTENKYQCRDILALLKC
jgi:hypothetical protein